MNKKEIRKKIEELIAKRKAMLEKIDEAKDSGELDAIENELRKLNMQLNGYKAQLDEADPDEEGNDNDPAWRKVEDEPDTRSLAPLNGIVKAAGKDADIRKGDDTSDMQYRKAFMDYVMRKKPIPAELRADEVTMTGDVDVLIPKVIINRILEEIENIGMILPLVTRTYYKGYVSIPVSNVRPVATWVAEGEGSDKQKKTVTGTIDLKAFKLRCAIAITLEVDVMSLEIFETTFVRQVLEAMEKALEEAIINGKGEEYLQPKGILTETPPEGQALTASAPSYQLITAAEGVIPSAYERNAIWCMTKKTFMSFIGMTDATGQPIARVNSGFSGRPERTLLGRNVVITDYMDSLSVNLEGGKIWAFMYDFKDFLLNMNMNIRTKWYEDNENEDQIFKAVALADGKAIRVNSLVTIAMPTEAETTTPTEAETTTTRKTTKSSLTSE